MSIKIVGFCISAGFVAVCNQAFALSGKVVTSTGNAIPNAEITLVGEGVQVHSDAHGHFELPDKTVDEIHIEAPGFSHRVLHLHGASQQSITVVLQATAIEQVDVIGLPLHASTMESAQPISVLTGAELRSKQAATLGETLAHEVGVNTSYFGPVASSPIIRGLDGPRVLIAQNGLDVGDVSRIGPDHVVSTEASTATQIEVLRGPATLFFGSGAIGGVVNVVDDRVPGDNSFKGAYSLSHNTVSNQNEAAAALTSGVSSVAFHLDGFWRENDDYRIPVEADADHEQAGANSTPKLENSAGDSHGANLGGSWLLDRGYVGISYGKLEKLNGVPGHEHSEEAHDEEAETDHEEDEGRVLSDLSQDRWQLISELELGGRWLTGINTRMGYTDYQHTELHELGSGEREPATEFFSTTTQMRMDFLQGEIAGWRGATSLEIARDELDVRGEEAFTPYTQTDRIALAVMEEKHHGDILWQWGARVERVTMEADSHAELDIDTEGNYKDVLEQSFTPLSVSLGGVWDIHPAYNLALSLTHAERAASAGELFAAGPHAATGTYELGAIFNIVDEGHGPEIMLGEAPQKETSGNIDLSLRKHHGDLGLVLNLFYNAIRNYYYLADTGLDTHELFEHEEHDDPTEEEGHEVHDLPVYLYRQADARFYGIEAELVWQIGNAWRARFWGDALQAELKEGANLPRMPAHRLATQWNYRYSGWGLEFNAVHTFEQNEVAALESASEAYTLIDAQLSYRIPFAAGNTTVFLKGENLTDTEARLHTSFLKDVAPLPGRGFRLGIRGEW